MGNVQGGATTAKIMKVTGETMKLSTPVRAGDVVKDYPGHVLLESESVKSLGIKSRPLQPHQELENGRLYFLVELPKEAVNDDKAGRRFQLGNKPSASRLSRAALLSKEGNGHGGMRLKMRLPKAEMEKLIKESKDQAEVANKIMELYVALVNANDTNEGLVARRAIAMEGSKDVMKTREKRVRFLPVVEDKQVAMASEEPESRNGELLEDLKSAHCFVNFGVHSVGNMV